MSSLLSIQQCIALAKHPKYYHIDNVMEALAILTTAGHIKLTENLRAHIELRKDKPNNHGQHVDS